MDRRSLLAFMSGGMASLLNGVFEFSGGRSVAIAGEQATFTPEWPTAPCDPSPAPVGTVQFGASLRSERTSSLNFSGPIHEFNNYSVADARFVVPAGQTVVALGIASSKAGSWRPMLWGYFGSYYGGWRVIYRHPVMVPVVGTGTPEWVSIPRVRIPVGARVHVAGYYQGFGSALIPMSAGPRVEIYGDPSGSFTPQSGQWETPSLSARVEGTGSCDFFSHYDTPGFADGSGAWGSVSIANSVMSVSNFADDDNHTSGIGMLNLPLFIEDLSTKRADGSPHPVNLAGARITAKFRGVNYHPQDSQMYPWIQARHPNDQTKASNWCWTGMPLNQYLSDGQWHEIDFVLDPNGSGWEYAGNNVNKPSSVAVYHYLPLADTFANGVNFHMPLVRPAAGVKPTGSIEWDYFGLSCSFSP